MLSMFLRNPYACLRRVHIAASLQYFQHVDRGQYLGRPNRRRRVFDVGAAFPAPPHQRRIVERATETGQYGERSPAGEGFDLDGDAGERDALAEGERTCR